MSSGVVVILIMLFDILILTMSRELLLEFLAGEMNRKKARKLHASQNFPSKIRMNYIKPYITKYIKQFCVYYYIYQVTLYAFLPYCTVALLLYFILNEYLYYFLTFILLIKVVIFFSIRIQFKSDHTTKYSHK